tara:strand:- start:4195 stop:4323 length:129 start_codon:yes stop_codon:yes gene_type:complete
MPDKNAADVFKHLGNAKKKDVTRKIPYYDTAEIIIDISKRDK